MKKIIRWLCVMLIGALLIGCGKGSENAADNDALQENETTTTSEAEPYFLEFEGRTIEGESLTSDYFADSKLTMINVWATYCNPCLSEMPDLGEIAASYDKAEFQIIGIVCDVEDDADEKDIEYVKELVNETKADYPHLLLSESLYNNLLSAVYVVPTTFFVTNEGEVLGYVEGAQSKENWTGLINDLLAELE